MSATVAMPTEVAMPSYRPSTTGTMGVWNGTKDNKEGYIDYGTGETNVNGAKEIKVTVHDVRALDHKPSFNHVGYEMRRISTALTADELLAGNSPEGKSKIHDAYFAECTRIVQQVVGKGPKILPSYFKVRKGLTKVSKVEGKEGDVEESPDVENTKKDRYGIRPFAHVDRDPNTIHYSVTDAVGAEEAAVLMKKYKRWAQVNVWRPIGNPASHYPLAFMDHQQIPEWDYDSHMGRIYSSNDPRNGERSVKAYDSIATYDPRYKYFYASDMTPDEVWVFCSFDTERKTVAPHGAFLDDNTPEDSPDRASIEVRLVVFFDEREEGEDGTAA